MRLKPGYFAGLGVCGMTLALLLPAVWSDISFAVKARTMTGEVVDQAVLRERRTELAGNSTVGGNVSHDVTTRHVYLRVKMPEGAKPMLCVASEEWFDERDRPATLKPGTAVAVLAVPGPDGLVCRFRHGSPLVWISTVLVMVLGGVFVWLIAKGILAARHRDAIAQTRNSQRESS